MKKFKGYLYNFIEKVFPKLGFFMLVLFIMIYIVAVINIEFKNKISTFMIPMVSFIEKSIVTQNRGESFLNMSVLIISFYVTVISVFGVGFSRATVLLAQKDEAISFIKYSKYAILSSVLCLITTIFYDSIAIGMGIVIYALLLLWTFANFIRFVIISIEMFSANILNAYKDAEDERKQKENYSNTIEAIYQLLKKEIDNPSELVKRAKAQALRERMGNTEKDIK